MTKIERIRKVVKWLVNYGIAHNQAEVGRLMGYTNASAFSKVLNEKTPIPSQFIKRLCNLDDRVNESWLLNEDGKMLSDTTNKNDNKMKNELDKLRSENDYLWEELRRKNAIIDQLLGLSEDVNKQTGT